jgi:hypothetical protein
MSGVLQNVVVTTPPLKPQRIERDDAYVAYREYNEPAW